MIAVWLSAVALLVLPIWLFGRSKKRWVRALLVLPGLVLLLLCAGLVYFSVYYHALPETKTVLPESTLQLREGLYAWFFDGPGEDTALVFYPGAKVEAAAYAPLAAEIAAGGADCFLVEMPLHFAFFGINTARQLMETYDYDHWILAGHSLGGTAASIFAAAHPDSVAGLVMLASYPATELNGVSYLSVVADRDGILKREDYEKSRVLWPEDAKELVISGGNHAGFGDYGPQHGDGEATITADDQRKQTAQAVLRWIQAQIAGGNETA